MVLRRNPGEVIAIGPHVRQRRDFAAVAVKREQFLHQDGSRPAIQQQVMQRKDEPIILRSKPDQREAQERRRAHIKAQRAILHQQLG